MPGAGLPPRETTKQDIQTDVLLWHARRDSNPQPSEPESDALSIEPLAHFIDSLCIIPTFFIFVKGCAEKYFLVFRPCSAKTVVFSEYMWYNSEKC